MLVTALFGNARNGLTAGFSYETVACTHADEFGTILVTDDFGGNRTLTRGEYAVGALSAEHTIDLLADQRAKLLIALAGASAALELQLNDPNASLADGHAAANHIRAVLAAIGHRP